MDSTPKPTRNSLDTENNKIDAAEEEPRASEPSAAIMRLRRTLRMALARKTITPRRKPRP